MTKKEPPYVPLTFDYKKRQNPMLPAYGISFEMMVELLYLQMYGTAVKFI